MEIHKHYRNKPIRMAKCGKYSYSRCMGNCKRPEECKTCTLVKRYATDLYKLIGSEMHKKCPKCGQYRSVITDYYKNSSRYTLPSWCRYCHNELQRNNQLKKKNNEKAKSI